MKSTKHSTESRVASLGFGVDERAAPNYEERTERVGEIGTSDATVIGTSTSLVAMQWKTRKLIRPKSRDSAFWVNPIRSRREMQCSRARSPLLSGSRTACANSPRKPKRTFPTTRPTNTGPCPTERRRYNATRAGSWKRVPALRFFCFCVLPIGCQSEAPKRLPSRTSDCPIRQMQHLAIPTLTAARSPFTAARENHKILVE